MIKDYTHMKLITLLIATLLFIGCSKEMEPLQPDPPPPDTTKVDTTKVPNPPIQFNWCRISEFKTFVDRSSSKFKITYDTLGIPNHITMTIQGNFSHIYELDYDIAVVNNSLHFTGANNGIGYKYYFIDGDPFSGQTYYEDDENGVYRGDIGFSIHFTENGKVSNIIGDDDVNLLSFEYNDIGNITRMNTGRFYDFKYDDRGNILSIKSENLAGVNYSYDYTSKPDTLKNNIYMFSGIACGSIYYSILEALGFFQPNDIRTSHEISWGVIENTGEEDIIDVFDFTNHKFDENGNLISYSTKGSEYFNIYYCN